MYIIIKKGNGELLILSCRKTGFLRFLIYIESALIMLKKLCTENNYLF